MATTKTKKVATPIDERETFVSLQKTFADSEQGAQEKLQILYKLQQTDNEIDKLVQLRGELPEEVRALENSVEALKSKYAHVEDVISGFGKAIEDAKQQIVDNDAETEKYQRQLENISNSREYGSINKEIENLGLLRQIAEKNIAESRLEIEDRKKDLESLSAQISIREDDLVMKREELSGIVESTAKEEAELQARRNALAASMDERTMSAYDRIRASVHNHLAVVNIYNGDSCGGCFNTITPQRILDINSCRKLVICEHCGRIIVGSEPQE